MELLVVIAIIAILAAILLPAMNSAIKKGEEAQALTEVKSIETAVKAYLNEYSKFPHSSGANFDHSYGESGSQDNEYLMNVLRSVVGNGNGGTGTNNPRKMVFLEVSETSLKNPAGTITGNFFDPWGNQYRITCDTQFDNDCEPPVGAGFGTVTNRNVIVWSRGWKASPAFNDFIRSWK